MQIKRIFCEWFERHQTDFKTKNWQHCVSIRDKKLNFHIFRLVLSLIQTTHNFKTPFNFGFSHLNKQTTLKLSA